jgi:hypothetical protein
MVSVGPVIRQAVTACLRRRQWPFK